MYQYSSIVLRSLTGCSHSWATNDWSLGKEIRYKSWIFSPNKYLNVSMLLLINFHNIYTISNFLLQRFRETNSLLKNKMLKEKLQTDVWLGKRLLLTKGCVTWLITNSNKGTYIVATAGPFDLAGERSHISYRVTIRGDLNSRNQLMLI